jgi:L-aminopeptidase/D-esterase-like protein
MRDVNLRSCQYSTDKSSRSGGTPMVSFGMKGGTGTSSRTVPGQDGKSYTVGVLVQVINSHFVLLTRY